MIRQKSGRGCDDTSKVHRIGLTACLNDFLLSLPDLYTDILTNYSNSIYYMAIPTIIAAYSLWFGDRRIGELIIASMTIAVPLANKIKYLIHQPRPWNLDPSIHHPAGSRAGGYSMPSGHAATLTSGYAPIMAICRKPAVWIACIFAIVSMCFVRMLLGVHTPLDVSFGVLISICVVIVLMRIMEYSRTGEKAFIIVSIGFLMVAAMVFTNYFIIDGNLTPSAGFNLMYTGFLFGFAIGRPAEHFLLRYEAPSVRKVVSIPIAVAGVVVLGAVEYYAMNVFSGWMTFACGVFYTLFLLFIAPWIISLVANAMKRN